MKNLNIKVYLFIFSWIFFTINLYANEKCYECHSDIKLVKTNIIHSTDSGISCEDCHGQGGDHMKNPKPDNILNFDNISPKQIFKICSSCHKKNIFSDSSHFKYGKSCLDCHVIVHSKKDLAGRIFLKNLLKTFKTTLCVSCHKREKTKMNQPYHHPIDEFENVCVTCHNSHTSKKELFIGSIAEKCLSCHPEAAGPYMFTHIGTDHKRCMECHEPHGSTNPDLLIYNSVYILCLSCHSDTPSFHDLGDSRYKYCISCHSRIHGSNLNPFFME